MRCRPSWSLSTLGSKHACDKNRRSSVTYASISVFLPHFIPSSRTTKYVLGCCCLHIRSRSDLYSVTSNIRSGPTDANTFRSHRLTTKKGIHTLHTVLPDNASLSPGKPLHFSPAHATCDSCGHLGGSPRCFTVCCSGVRSFGVTGQLCPTISIKLSTAKVRRLKKCGGVTRAQIPTGWDRPRHLPHECRASRDIVCRQRKTHTTSTPSEFQVSENPW